MKMSKKHFLLPRVCVVYFDQRRNVRKLIKNSLENLSILFYMLISVFYEQINVIKFLTPKHFFTF